MEYAGLWMRVGSTLVGWLLLGIITIPTLTALYV